MVYYEMPQHTPTNKVLEEILQSPLKATTPYDFSSPAVFSTIPQPKNTLPLLKMS
jgi:hypothetical protein